MYRALPVARQAATPASRGLVRVSRRRFATETSETLQTTAPKKKKRVLRRIVFYTTAATTTYYVGSAFVAFNNREYYNFFTDNVPFATSMLEFGEKHGWDTLTVNEAIYNTVDASISVYEFVRKQLGYTAEEAKEAAKQVKAATSEKAKDAEKKIQDTPKRISDHIKTGVKISESKVYDKGAKAAAIARHQADQFSDGVEDLIRKAEAALADEPIPGDSQTGQAKPGVPDALGPRQTEIPLATTAFSEQPKNVYDAPLPVGFEPPPGFSRPVPPKPAEPSEPFPLVAPAVAELNSSEPVLSHLAGTIDDLAAFLKDNPNAATKARDVLDTARGDLTSLAQDFDKLREEEQRKLEQQLDEQARQYTLKLLELELEGQDKLDSQEAGFREYVEEEKAKFAKAYRDKLDQELRVQRELINERLKEEVVAQGIELQRRWIREVKVRVEEERGGRLAKLDELAANLKRLERIALDNSTYLDENLRLHTMWSAIRALSGAVDGPARRPFRDELRVLRHITAAKDDPVVSAALETLDASDVPDIGVEPLADLASWFATSVAPRVSRVALVPDQNAGVLSHLASHVLSAFTFRKQGLVAGDDVLSVLSRAEYYLNEKDLDAAARELNQLKGTPKVLLKDWLEAARRRLEVQQALEVVQTQATLASLLVL
ncbi:hypothetical protein EVG20_g5970 [Dentipellis fragilis]|uniref:MICOS complex subunit MIC60 n=1 Tax=Dentipellis fragilis TaxID=205917 RepID=A0A4Y9YP61_9AGAM|nr:hypothetical protein EVG20_g5970 [Dentipellis fragilis]